MFDTKLKGRDSVERNLAIIRMKDMEGYTFHQIATHFKVNVLTITDAYKRTKNAQNTFKGNLAWINMLSARSRKALQIGMCSDESRMTEQYVKKVIDNDEIWALPGIGKATVAELIDVLDIDNLNKNKNHETAIISGYSVAGPSKTFLSQEMLEFLKTRDKNPNPPVDADIGTLLFCNAPIEVNGVKAPVGAKLRDKRPLPSGSAMFLINTGKQTSSWLNAEKFWTTEQVLKAFCEEQTQALA